MEYISRMIALILFLSLTSLEANSFTNFSSITWNWIVIATLSILFFVILLSILRDIKKTKKHINNIFNTQKNENLTKNSYLSDINNDRALATSDLKESIKSLSVSTSNDREIFRKLSKDYKDIFLTNKEESIFLAIVKGNKIGKTECFFLEEFIDELYEYNIIESKKYNLENNIVVANKEILADIFLLLNKLQTKEHNLKRPKFKIEINNRNNLTIIVDKKLKLDKNIKSVLEQNIKPIYNESDNSYSGIYLYLLKYLTNMINATLKINLNDNSYMVTVNVPIDIKRNIINSKKPTLSLKEPKKALIVSEKDTAQEVAKYLKKLNIIADIKPLSELNKELPNFIEYDITFIYSKIFEPILTDYLRAIKTYSLLKIVALVDSKNSLYPTKIVDKVVNLDNKEDELYSTILELYKDELNTGANTKKIERVEVDSNRRYGKVLIADDDITNLHILEYMFKKYGIKAITVTNGVDALNMLERESFDMIILDSVMPKLDGYKTVQKIRENSKFNSTPIIIHTSFSRDESSMDKIFKLGFDSYLAKPFNQYDFKSLIERYMPVYSEPINIKDKESSKKANNTNSKESIDKDSLKEFIAIYGDSDKMLSRYIKEKRETQAFALIDDLKDLATKIGANDFINLLENIEENLKIKHEVDNSLIYQLSNNLTELKKDIIKKLSA